MEPAVKSVTETRVARELMKDFIRAISTAVLSADHATAHTSKAEGLDEPELVDANRARWLIRDVERRQSWGLCRFTYRGKART